MVSAVADNWVNTNDSAVADKWVWRAGVGIAKAPVDETLGGGVVYGCFV